MSSLFSLGRIVLAAGFCLPSAAFCDTLGAGEVLGGALGQGPALIALEVAPQAYVSGRFAPQGGEQVLSLISPTGAPRELARGRDGAQRFQLIAPAGGALQVTGAQGSAFSLEIEQVVPLEAQRAPADEPLSPRIAALAQSVAQGGSSETFWAEVAAQGTPLVG